MTGKKSSIYLSEEIRLKLRCPPRGQSQAVSTVIDRYTTLIETERNKVQGLFSTFEWDGILLACKNSDWSKKSIISVVLYDVKCESAENLTLSTTGKEILEEKLRDLTLLQGFALAELIEEYWER